MNLQVCIYLKLYYCLNLLTYLFWGSFLFHLDSNSHFDFLTTVLGKLFPKTDSKYWNSTHFKRQGVAIFAENQLSHKHADIKNQFVKLRLQDTFEIKP